METILKRKESYKECKNCGKIKHSFKFDNMNENKCKECITEPISLEKILDRLKKIHITENNISINFYKLVRLRVD
jgi:hypothetical protein